MTSGSSRKLPQDGVATAANVALVIRAFEIALKTTRAIYLDGESFQVRVRTDDPQGEPTGERLAAVLLKIVTRTIRPRSGDHAENVATDAKTGDVGRGQFKADDDEGGQFIA